MIKANKYFYASLLILIFSMSYLAANITVTNTNDAGAGSLRSAVASAAVSGDTIQFNLSGCPCTITLTGGQIAINKSLTINGLGADLLSVSGNNASRVFSVNGGANVVTINDLTITNGSSIAEGGGILNNSILIINNSVVRNSTTTFIAGGGIASFGELTVRNSTVSGNSSNGLGGGIYIRNGATNVILNSDFINNIAVADGGGLYLEQGIAEVGSGNFQGNTATTGGAIGNQDSMTVTNTNIESNQATNGGGIYNRAGTLTLDSTTVQSNTASGDGGGIYNFNAGNTQIISLTNGAIVMNNQAANGGGIKNNGILNITNSTLSGNTATTAGGGINNNFTANLTGSTLNGNSAIRGGGIFNDRGVTITNSTLSGNQATGNTLLDGGGAIHNSLTMAGTATINLLNATIAGNSAVTRGGGVRNAEIVNSKNTIFALNSAPTAPDFDGGFLSTGFNLFGNSSGVSGFLPSDLQNVNPNLGALTDNGGLTQTRALLAGSPAINGGTNTNAPNIDQRGLSRPMSGTTDIGAFEFNTCGTSLVINANDSGPGSLRCAIAAALNTDIVNFNLPPNSTITLSSEILLDKPILIDGTGLNLTISGNHATNIFSNVSTVLISGLTIANGVGVAGAAGGITNIGNLTVVDCSFTGNSGGNGGAISNFGGTAEILNSTFSGNLGGLGGAIYNSSTTTSGTIRVINSTISGNSAFRGGGIFTELPIAHAPDSITLIINATIAGNTATNSGGGIDGLATIKNTIIATNSGGFNPDISGAISSLGFNLIGDTTGGAGFVATDLQNVNPLLGNLVNNGGTTKTRALLAGSPAIDKGGAADLLTGFSGLKFSSRKTKNLARITSLAPIDTDQRGMMRPIDVPSILNAAGGDGSDIGAFEVAAPTAANASISGRVLSSTGGGISKARVTLTDSSGATLTAVTNSFGNYRFAETTVGETYVIQVFSKNGQFTPQVINLTDELNELNFIAQE